jgi:hypothetical protein
VLHFRHGTVTALRVPPADAVHVVLDGDTGPVPFLAGDLLQMPAQEGPQTPRSGPLRADRL